MSNKKIAYLSMEFAIHQSLRIYSGGLGFLSGSHMRSAHDLRQDVTGVGILYSHGYYDQIRASNGHMEVRYIRRQYPFLQDTGIVFVMTIHSSPVKVKAFLLRPEVFGTVPIYLLTTDIPENDHLARTTCYRLYDHDPKARIAQLMVLGIGGALLFEALGQEPDVYHLNEGHGLALLFHLYAKYRDAQKVRNKVVFTTHTPEKAGNEEIDMGQLNDMSFFSGVSYDEINQIGHVESNKLNLTLTALRLSRIANGVSKIHGTVANSMWKEYRGVCEIISITNAQNRKFWMDPLLEKFLHDDADQKLVERKKELKRELLEVVADQCSRLFDPDVLTIVWARRFATYKRPDLLLRDYDRFMRLATRDKEPIQVIWAGKTFPEDTGNSFVFNRLIDFMSWQPRCAVLLGYELRLSAILKKGADIWLNTPIITREASGTSGMTAAMNGAINFSIPDGWIPEFAKHGENAFVIPSTPAATPEEQDVNDNVSMLDVLEREIIPLYYHDKEKWTGIMKQSMRDIVPAFDSERMAGEYEAKLYNP